MTVYFADDDVTLHHGDCVEVMDELAPESVDAVVTDPPYGLSDWRRQRDPDCLSRILADVGLPDDRQWDFTSSENVELSIPTGSSPTLRGMFRTVGVDTRISVPEGSVDFESRPLDEEVKHGAVAATAVSEGDLPFEGDSEPLEDFGDFVLQFANAAGVTFCDGSCRCFTEPSDGVLAVSVVPVAATGGPGFLRGSRAFRWARWVDDVVGLVDHPFGVAETPSGVVTLTRAVDPVMLRFDMRGDAAELLPTRRAIQLDPVAHLLSTELVGAGPGAGGLPSVFEPVPVGLVGGSTDRTLTVHVPADIRTHGSQDTRAGGFMGRSWDGWESPQAYQRWVSSWAAAAYRVAKPGAHLLAFGGTRTSHRLVCGLEDAGWTIRDTLAWLYGQGFPKSHDVSKAIDKAAGAEREVMATQKRRDIRNGPGRGRGEGIDAGQRVAPEYIDHKITAPATAPAKRWDGWGTALKPAHEPIVLARKPLDGTVADNVLAHGTGALNIDGTRIATDGRSKIDSEGGTKPTVTTTYAAGAISGSKADGLTDQGRWPANVVLDEEAARQLDEQAGERRTSGTYVRSTTCEGEAYGDGLIKHAGTTHVGYGDFGGPSRFYYTTKASTSEKPWESGDETTHPTVKPLDLMRWLVRLVTPPGGLVLDPFAGTGTTAEACVIEGFCSMLIEEHEPYCELCVKRLTKPIQPTIWGG